jgi:hypothetical protein
MLSVLVRLIAGPLPSGRLFSAAGRLLERNVMDSISKAKLLAAVSAGLCLTGLCTYFFLLDWPLVRNTAALNVGMLVAGTALGLVAVWQARQRWAVVLVTAEGLLAVLFVAMLWMGFALPAAQAVPTGRQAPAFSLPDHRAETVSLAQYRGRGPVFLVFYRGYW